MDVLNIKANLWRIQRPPPSTPCRSCLDSKKYSLERLEMLQITSILPRQSTRIGIVEVTPIQLLLLRKPFLLCTFMSSCCRKIPASWSSAPAGFQPSRQSHRRLSLAVYHIVLKNFRTSLLQGISRQSFLDLGLLRWSQRPRKIDLDIDEEVTSFIGLLR